ncbi:MAG: hypothetical protein R2857_07350 [Vampirovibrionales bacterium]
MTRTTREKMDVAVCELGNTVGFFGLLWGGGALVDKLLKHNGLNVINQPGVLSRGRVAKSLLLIPPLFAFMAAMPFIRNAYTAYSSGTTNFKNLITRQGQSPNRNPTSFASAFLHPAEVANQKERGEVMAKVRHDLMLGRDIFLVGTALGLLGFGLASGSMGRFSLFSGSSNRLTRCSSRGGGPLAQESAQQGLLPGEALCQRDDGCPMPWPTGGYRVMRP